MALQAFTLQTSWLLKKHHRAINNGVLSKIKICSHNKLLVYDYKTNIITLGVVYIFNVHMPKLSDKIWKTITAEYIKEYNYSYMECIFEQFTKRKFIYILVYGIINLTSIFHIFLYTRHFCSFGEYRQRKYQNYGLK